MALERTVLRLHGEPARPTRAALGGVVDLDERDEPAVGGDEEARRLEPVELEDRASDDAARVRPGGAPQDPRVAARGDRHLDEPVLELLEAREVIELSTVVNGHAHARRVARAAPRAEAQVSAWRLRGSVAETARPATVPCGARTPRAQGRSRCRSVMLGCRSGEPWRGRRKSSARSSDSASSGTGRRP